MDLRRIKKNIQSRKWESKSMKTNIDYIKKQLKQFGLSAPKYLNKDKNSIKYTHKLIVNDEFSSDDEIINFAKSITDFNFKGGKY